MALTVNTKHGVLATQFGTWFPGEKFVRPAKMPAEQYKAYVDNQVLIPDEHGIDEEENLEEEDELTPLTRQQLLLIIRLNNLKEQFGTTVYKSNTDEQVRQLIRDASPDLSKLKMPDFTQIIAASEAVPPAAL